MLLLENNQDHGREAIEEIKERIDRMNEKKIDPMKIQVQDIHDAMEKRTGFRAGVIISVTTIWAILAFVVVNFLGFFKE